MTDVEHVHSKVRDLLAQIRAVAARDKNIRAVITDKHLEPAEFLFTDLGWVVPAIGFMWDEDFRVVTETGFFGKALGAGLNQDHIPVLRSMPRGSLQLSSDSNRISHACLDLLFLPSRGEGMRPEFFDDKHVDLLRHRWFRTDAMVIASEVTEYLNNESGDVSVFLEDFLTQIKEARKD